MNTATANISITEFEDLFRTHYAELCGFANKFLRDIEAAEEIVQSVFVKFWESKEETNIQSSPKSYLFTAVKNTCLNQLKHFKIKEDYKQHNQREIDLENLQQHSDLETNEVESKIHAAIDALPEGRKKIFILSRFEGLKYQEIANKLNISIKTVENQMGSALKQLKVDLAEFLSLLFILINCFK